MAAHSALWKEAKKDKILLCFTLPHLSFSSNFDQITPRLFIMSVLILPFYAPIHLPKRELDPIHNFFLLKIVMLNCTTILLKLIYACSIDNKEAESH